MKLKLFYRIILSFFILSSCGDGDDTKKLEQTIIFEALPPCGLNVEQIELYATASSGLPITFTSQYPEIASISGNVVTLHKGGNSLITARQEGNDTYYEAPQITRMLLIYANDPNKKDQTITFSLEGLTLWTISDGGLNLTTYARSTSGLPITFSTSRPDVAYVENGELKVVYGVDRQSIMIYASQPGNNEYNPAKTVGLSLQVECDQH